MTQSKQTPVRIHTHFGRVVINDADGYLTPEQAEALAYELNQFVLALGLKKHRCTRLVYPDGRMVNESDGKPEAVYV